MQSTQLNSLINAYKVVVYYATIPQDDFVLDLPTAQRNDEIATCLDKQTQRQKYFVWKLLLDAIGQNYGTDPVFAKQPTGKWTCNLCEFSLSHSANVVAVALASCNTGVDVQGVALPKNDRLLQRIFSSSEMQRYIQLDNASQQALYFTQVWTQKESIFKSLNKSEFLPTNPQNYTQHTVSQVVELDGKQYIITVACSKDKEVCFVKVQM